MVGPLSKLFKEFHAMDKSGKLQKSSSQKLMVRFHNSMAEMILTWNSTKIFHGSLKNMDSRGWGQFRLYYHVEKTLKTLLLKTNGQISNNLAAVTLRWTSTKIVQAVMAR